MKKIFYKELSRCNECPYLWTDDLTLLTICLNPEYGDPDGREIDVYGSDIYIPTWCKLPDKENNKCTCERCSGIDVESTYEKVEKVVKAIEEKGKRQADFDRHKTDIL